MENGAHVQTADERLAPKRGKGGIFVIDQWGTMHAGQKVQLPPPLDLAAPSRDLANLADRLPRSRCPESSSTPP